MTRRWLPRSNSTRKVAIHRHDAPAYLNEEEKAETLVRLRKDLESNIKAHSDISARPAGDVNQSRKKRESLEILESQRWELEVRIRRLDPPKEEESFRF